MDALLGEQDGVAGGLGELLDAGGHVDGIPDEGELQLAAPADGAGDYHPGVDTDTDTKLLAEPRGHEAVDRPGGPHGCVGVIGEVVGRPEDGQCAVTEELVDVSSGLDDGGHHDLEQRVEAGDGVLGGVGFGVGVKSRMSMNITVTSRRSPVKTSLPCSSSFAARAGST